MWNPRSFTLDLLANGHVKQNTDYFTENILKSQVVLQNVSAKHVTYAIQSVFIFYSKLTNPFDSFSLEPISRRSVSSALFKYRPCDRNTPQAQSAAVSRASQNRQKVFKEQVVGKKKKHLVRKIKSSKIHFDTFKVKVVNHYLHDSRT